MRELARDIEGTVVTPASPAYRRDKVLVDSRFDGTHPRAIVYCESAADVEKTVRWARKHAIHLVPRCGGHSYAGYSTTSTGVVVDVSRMHRVHLRDGVATVGAGARLIDVYAPLAAHGHTIPAGSCPTVGIAGHAQGGGVGYAGRKLGLTCDNVAGLSLVTAAGKLLECSEHENADHELRVPDAPGRRRRVLPGRLALVRWRAVEAWQHFAPHAPDALYASLYLATNRRSAEQRDGRHALVHRRHRTLGGLSPARAVPDRRPSTVQGQVGLHQGTTHERRNPDAAAAACEPTPERARRLCFAYQNYIDPDLRSWEHAYYGSNLRRLAEAKRKHDPGNFFHFPQGIPRRVS